MEEVGGYKDPFTKHYMYPRLFVIRNDGSGYELLSKEQLEHYFRVQKHRAEVLKQRQIVLVGATSAKCHYFVTKVKTLQENLTEMNILKHLNFP